MSSMVWRGPIQMNPGTSFDDYRSFREKMSGKDRDPLRELKERERRLNADDGEARSTVGKGEVPSRSTVIQHSRNIIIFL